MLGDAGHRGARADEARKEWLQRTLVDLFHSHGGAFTRAAQLESLSCHGGKHTQTTSGTFRQSAGGDHRAETWGVAVATERLGQQHPLSVADTALVGRARQPS